MPSLVWTIPTICEPRPCTLALSTPIPPSAQYYWLTFFFLLNPSVPASMFRPLRCGQHSSAFHSSSPVCPGPHLNLLLLQRILLKPTFGFYLAPLFSESCTERELKVRGSVSCSCRQVGIAAIILILCQLAKFLCRLLILNTPKTSIRTCGEPTSSKRVSPSPITHTPR